MEDMEILESHRRLSGRHHRICYIGKIISAGSMIGTALLFPFTYGGELPLHALMLAIFSLSLLVFVALHLEPFIRIGPYTAPMALFILLFLVLPGGSGGTEYTLRDLDGARRDPQAAHFIYGNSHVDQVRLPSGDLRLVTARGADAYEAVAGMELDRDRISQDSALESRAPLLGSND
ncbi:hypothetical protein NKR19_g1237 [Coniochaeta hoffmannii]|uniref:Uncharacterized protein n=1 Tax=Coniochaeta hoffmannii TaxID=91930 RepID=A0AA38RYU7_9PEZI|nr:hypothetical protein NKR19_g1237 [Coniochaeta hoffmannii]